MPTYATDYETGIVWDVTDPAHPKQVNPQVFSPEKVVFIASGTPDEIINNQSIDAAFHQGEKGIITCVFSKPVFNPALFILTLGTPVFAVDTIESRLKAQGVELWKSSEIVGDDTVKIYFVTGFAPLAIIGIILAAGAAVALLIHTIVVERVNYDQAQNVIDQQNAVNQNALDIIKTLPPDQQLTALRNWSQTIAETQRVEPTNPLDFLKTSMTVIVVAVVLILALPSILGAIRK